MNILHLLSNRKWTERSEPVADLVLAQQALGHHAQLLCGKWTLDTNEESSAAVQAKKKGLDPVILNLNKHFSWSGMKEDVPALASLIDREQIDVLHAHMENGHLLAALARKKSTRKPKLVVSNYAVQGPARGLRTSILYKHATDACTVISEEGKRAVISRHHLPDARVTVIEPGIDLERFHPARPIAEPFQVEIPEDAQVIGMVTRIRADRRVDVAVSALHLLKDKLPHLYFLLVGHGEEENRIRAQVEEAGLEERVIWGGYCRGDQLALAYRAMDVLLYPIPGTDQSCRTVREAQAAGVPVLSSRTGFLSTLIEENQTGLFADVEPNSVAQKLEQLLADPNALDIFKARTLERAGERFNLALQAEKNLAVYQQVLNT
jgi:glycosyltransferase involved in cell wall biosynthesis